MGKKSRRSNRKGHSMGQGKNRPVILDRLLKLDEEVRESKENMLWSKAAHKIRECIEIVQEIQDRILKSTGTIEIYILEQKAVCCMDLIRVEYNRYRFDNVLQICNDIQMSPENEKNVLSLDFLSKLYGQLALLRLDVSKENKDKIVSFIDTRISERINDTYVVTTALEAVRILRSLKEYDAAIALGEKLERLTENCERVTSDNSIADVVTFVNAVTHLERYRIEYHQQVHKDFSKYFLVLVQELFDKFDDISGKNVICQRDAYFMMIAQREYLCHQIDDKQLSSQLCSNAIEYVETYLERAWHHERHCFTCHEKRTTTEALVCSGCRVACYCSLDHQRMTWKKDAIQGMRIGHEILCPLWKAFRKWKLVSKKGNERAMKLRNRLDRECLYFLSHGLGLKGKCFEEKNVHTFYQSVAE
ncbi:predicted protein [Chaetoceros tenuissimus]|uniref:MYND-type domain-containing protein n=1 Tax=Chaetoceros tenuissimus TaxID=426638 RepID=A0AAD3CEZ7_9STRA|nr:predicted protein [Chaetoceros tenuissimus]